MKENAFEILKKLEDNGYEAYIVGGFVRDYLINRKSLDVDICTNATPKDLNVIFEGAILPSVSYGSVTLMYKKGRYEITTYRRELRYDDYRRPAELQYINNLDEDIMRRDFTINTLCMDSHGNIIDLLGARKELDNKVIKTVGNPDTRLREDVLRILRAVRFASLLNFNIDDEVKDAIRENAYLLKNLSYERKKEELTKIFTSPYALYGIKIIIELGLDKYLELSNLSNLKIVDDILGIWAQLDVLDIYPFSKTEREIITSISKSLNDKIDNYMLYKNGLYVSTIIASIKGIDKKRVNEIYKNIPIKEKKDIVLDVNQLCNDLNIKPSYWLNDLYKRLEIDILNGNLENNHDSIKKYAIRFLKEKLLLN